MSQRPQIKTPDQVRRMRAAGLIVAEALKAVTELVRPGVTAATLDDVAREVIHGYGATPSFLGYHGFPASTCISVDNQVVHGIPLVSTVLHEGSIVSIDCGAILDGWHADAAITVAVGEIDPAVADLSRVTEQALWSGLAVATVGARLGDIGAAVAKVVLPHGYGILAEFTGHGIGTEMHQPPDVHNLPGERGGRLKLVAGHVLAVEPMVTLGSPEVAELDDDWTVVTLDGRPAAHWEHTVAVTPTGPWVLTAFDGGASQLGPLVSDEAT